MGRIEFVARRPVGTWTRLGGPKAAEMCDATRRCGSLVADIFRCKCRNTPSRLGPRFCQLGFDRTLQGGPRPLLCVCVRVLDCGRSSRKSTRLRKRNLVAYKLNSVQSRLPTSVQRVLYIFTIQTGSYRNETGRQLSDQSTSRATASRSGLPLELNQHTRPRFGPYSIKYYE